mmetsp:Transcript_46062/g.127998  ORF Transcript_46062/g.127998 Transcript_46062/m.127998 type:complete len:222 (-) Transcript_46062:80-745(-)|eukprot:CAMPEP_0117556054 /NCGR_PEP_ID=MMETSP0784-20121206/51601_1 /TAXON_ID=39447 /ORGANISM="" /LENGTH=221 /DNA_ID=CAMNT_0005353297 /DNA_START=66 /DNA_END=731 /DNA_ORIENTATION=+
MVLTEQLTTAGTPAVPAESMPMGQIENCERLSSVEKEASALHRNIAQKGGNAYYYAHTREYQIPENAKILTGPGLVAGGLPQRLSGPDDATSDAAHETPDVAKRTEPSSTTALPKKRSAPEMISLNDYSWVDEVHDIKVYIKCDGLPSGPTDDLVNAVFEPLSMRIEVSLATMRVFKVNKLFKEIKPEECAVRVNPAKGKITVTLKKKRLDEWKKLEAKTA